MTHDSVRVEACVTSADEAVSCFEAGADRVELCRALDVGGLTPGADAIEATLAAGPGPINVLVRPTAGAFRLDPAAMSALVDEVASLASLDVDGLVVGVLDADGHVDRTAVDELVHAADGLPVTFHRAFDHVDDPLAELESLARTGVRRVLTAGGAPTAWAGRDTLRALVAATGDDLTVLGGGRIRGDHVRRLVDETGLTEVHARAAAIPGVVAGLQTP
jgi:copper homeostasis protein